MNRSRAGTPGSTISRGVSPSNTHNEDIFDNPTFRNAAKKGSSKRKADDASSRAGGSTTKRKRTGGKASRPASIFSGRQGSAAPSESTVTTKKNKGKGTGRSYAGSVLDGGDDGASSRGFGDDNRDEEDEDEDEDDEEEEEEVAGTTVDEWNLKTPITPEQEAIAQKYQETRVQLERFVLSSLVQMVIDNSNLAQSKTLHDIFTTWETGRGPKRESRHYVQLCTKGRAQSGRSIIRF